MWLKHLIKTGCFLIKISPMRKYKQNDLVIYTDSEGRRIDTFVIFDSEPETGLTHINHFNLKVDQASLELHPCAANTPGIIPMADPISFQLFTRLKEKYSRIDEAKTVNKSLILYRDINLPPLAQAS
jgi:hypothetical protein